MKKLKILLMGIVVLGIGLSSCKKKIADLAPKTPGAPKPMTPTPPGGYDGVFAAIKMTYSYPLPVTIPGMPVSSVDIDAEVASAAVANNKDFNSLVDVGTVKVNSYTLEKATNNAYYKMAMEGLSPTSLSITSGVTWDINGTTKALGTNFPTFKQDGIPAEINKSNDLTINLSSNVGGSYNGYAIAVISGSKSIIKTLWGYQASVTISKSELADLPVAKNNTALIEVCPFYGTGYTINGKNYYFVNETAAIRWVNVK
jgi:hypothetical protein